MDVQLIRVLDEIRSCQLCADSLSLGVRPIIQAAKNASLLIVGQAPGAKVHASGVPWDDASGERLREWLNISKEDFYDDDLVAIMPMGFCYPGRGKSGDLPPRSECAPTWHDLVLAQMPNIQLTVLIGQYAQQYYLTGKYSNLTETVASWRDHLPHYFVVPHPSPRNRFWLNRNPWFEKDVIPSLRQRVSKVLN